MTQRRHVIPLRPLGRLAAMTLLGLSLGSCGAAGSKPRSTSDFTHSPATTATGTNGVLDFGHEANRVDGQAVTALIQRYYDAAAAEDGRTACSLIPSSIARSVPEDYGGASGPSYLRGGRTCSEVLSRMFAHLHARLVADAATLRVTRIRLKAKGGYAIMSFGAPPEHEIPLVREGSAWKVSALIDDPLP